MSQDIQQDILSKENVTQSTSLTEDALSNALKQNSVMSDFAQQTLLDVNSQPLIPNLLENHPYHNTLNETKSLIHTDDHLISHKIETSIMPSVVIEDANSKSAENTSDGSSTVPKLDPSSPILTEFYEKFSTGRMFQSLEELRTEAFEYGRKHNVALTTSKSDKTKIYLICKHGGQYRQNNKRPQATNKLVKPRLRRSQKLGCPCMIYARCCRGSLWIVRKSIGEHNHAIAEDPRTYAMYRSLSPAHLAIVHRLLKEHVSVAFIVKSLRSSGINNILPKDIENIQQDLKRKNMLNGPFNYDSTYDPIYATAFGSGGPSAYASSASKSDFDSSMIAAANVPNPITTQHSTPSDFANSINMTSPISTSTVLGCPDTTITGTPSLTAATNLIKTLSDSKEFEQLEQDIQIAQSMDSTAQVEPTESNEAMLTPIKSDSL